MCAPSLGTANKNSNRTFQSTSGFSSRGFPLSSYGYLSVQICTYIRTRDASQLLKNGRHRSRYLCIDIPQGERERDPFSLVTKHASIFSAFFVARKNRMLQRIAVLVRARRKKSQLRSALISRLRSSCDSRARFPSQTAIPARISLDVPSGL